MCLCMGVCVCVCLGGGAGMGKCEWVWGLQRVHRCCLCGFSASVLQQWYEIRTKCARNSYDICAHFVRISYEIRPQGASNIGTVNVVVTNFAWISYELCTNFAQSANGLHEFVSFLLVCACVVIAVVVCVGLGGWCVRGWVMCACIGGSWVVGVWVCVGVDGWMGGCLLVNHVSHYFCGVCVSLFWLFR